MVLMNAGRRARYTDSLINQNQGGGDKKAGLVPTADAPYMRGYYIKNHQSVNTFTPFERGLQFTVNPSVCVSRGVGSTLTPLPYFRCSTMPSVAINKPN